MKIKTVGEEEIDVRSNFKDLTGQQFGRLSVLGLSRMSKQGAYWLCQCECGEQKVVRGKSLRSGVSTSCGCANREAAAAAHTTHGMSGHPAYSTWNTMLQRCTNPNATGYADYGGRGVKVCKQWYKFKGFWSDMASTWKEGLTLDRIHPDGNYCPENCRWLEPEKQPRNQRKMKNNTSGVTGVSFNKQDNSWRATWKDLDGKQCSKSFSTKKFGEKEAFRLACEARAEAIRLLNEQGAGYTEGHGL